MKSILKITLISVFLLMLIGITVSCNEVEKIMLYPTECGRFDLSETEFVSLCIVPSQCFPDFGYILRTENHTKKMLSFLSPPFYLEYFDGNDWGDIPLSGPWLAGPYIRLPAGEITESLFSLHSLIREFNNGRKGRYRIIFNYSLLSGGLSDGPLTSVAKFRLHAEFLIQ